MNQPETNLEVAESEPTLQVLEEEVRSLRTLLVCTLLVLLVLGGTLDVFLFVQSKGMGTQVAEQQKAIETFNNTTAPVMRDLWNKLLEYSATHPDFKTNVINKYGQYLGGMGGGSPTGVANTPPAQAPAPKK